MERGIGSLGYLTFVVIRVGIEVEVVRMKIRWGIIRVIVEMRTSERVAQVGHHILLFQVRVRFRLHLWLDISCIGVRVAGLRECHSTGVLVLGVQGIGRVISVWEKLRADNRDRT